MPSVGIPLGPRDRGLLQLMPVSYYVGALPARDPTLQELARRCGHCPGIVLGRVRVPPHLIRGIQRKLNSEPGRIVEDIFQAQEYHRGNTPAGSETAPEPSGAGEAPH